MAEPYVNGTAPDPRAPALQALLELVESRQLTRWRLPLLTWLDRFDGIGDWLPGPEDLPECEVRRILESATPGLSDESLAQCLAHADFL